MAAYSSYDDDMNDPVLNSWLGLCRTEDEKERTIAQWRERKAAERAEHDAETAAALRPRREQDEQMFKHMVRDRYPFSDESFEADWPALRARLIAELISKEVGESWTSYLARQTSRGEQQGSVE